MSKNNASTDTTMSGESLDMAEQRKQELKQLFPGVFTETVNEAGELVESIDFERLKAELGEFSDVFESRREKYGMDWPGKRDALRLIQEPSRATLKPCREESVDFDNTENLFIEGDNLEVLKLLQKSYYGKVKMIYIDPPYNTGKEFIYPDKYSESLDTYLAYAGLVDDEGRKFTTNTAAEGRFHTKWLNMMYPRLYLARNLLRDDGVIFISIDDNEQPNLRELCNELFGEECFLGQILWKSRQFTDARAKTNLSVDHEYILVYSKNIETALRGKERDESKYSNPDSDSRGAWMSRSMLGLANREQRPNLHYPITDPETENIFEAPENTGWRYSKERMNSMIQEGRVLFPKKPTGRPREKKFRSELENEFTAFPAIIDDIFTSYGTKEIREYFGEQVFDFPKPSKLIYEIVEQGCKKDDLFVDFFAGSCASAEALYRLNLSSSFNNHYVMVQLPELCDEKTVAHKVGYKTIADIGKERIRRAAKKIQEENPDYNGDLGFKVLKLDQSNFKQWQAPARNTPDDELIQQMELHIDHVQEAADPEAILYELLIKAGFMPTEKVETLTLAGKTVYSVAEGGLLVCLENEINDELIQAVADAEPAQFICLDKAFQGNDQLKANAVQTFKALNQNREVTIEFRTV